MPTSESEAPEANVRMTLVDKEFLSEHGGRLKAGTVVLVDERTARRWREKGIAVDSAKTDKTLREQKLAELQRLQTELEAIPDAGVYDQAISRGGEPTTVQRQRRT